MAKKGCACARIEAQAVPFGRALGERGKACLAPDLNRLANRKCFYNLCQRGEYVNSEEFVRYLNHKSFASYNQICAALATQVFSVKGDYGTAFYLKDGRVGKIFKKHDYAYRTFLILVANSTNVHLPKVYDIGEKYLYAWVILEFLGPCESHKRFQELNFQQIADGMTSIILDRTSRVNLPETLCNLANEMKVQAKGLCLDFHERNFGYRGDIIVAIDPFAIKTKTNSHLKLVEGAPLYKRVR